MDVWVEKLMGGWSNRKINKGRTDFWKDIGRRTILCTVI
jgi:hypothetical protein